MHQLVVFICIALVPIKYGSSKINYDSIGELRCNICVMCVEVTSPGPILRGRRRKGLVHTNHACARLSVKIVRVL